MSSNLRRMLSRAMRTSPWDDGKKDREWGQVKRRQRRIEQRETQAEADEAGRQNWAYLYRLAGEPAEVQSMADGDRHVMREPWGRSSRHAHPYAAVCTTACPAWRGGSYGEHDTFSDHGE
jgi:hypothetical protein